MKNIVALILAAGSSSRLGQPKQLVQIGGKALLQDTIEKTLASGVERVFVVVGAHGAEIKGTIKHLPVEVIENKNWANGMGSTISTGIHFIKNQTTDLGAVLILVCDQYLLTEKTLKEILSTWETTKTEIVASKYGSSFGVPALFSKSLFDELARLKGKIGAKKIIQQHLDKTVFVDFANGLMDLDTPEDLRQVVNVVKTPL